MPSQPGDKKDKKFVVYVTRVGGKAVISTRRWYIIAVKSERWGLLRVLGDGFIEEVASVILQRVIERAPDPSLLKKVVVSRSEWSALLWMAGRASKPRRLLRSLYKAWRKELMMPGRRVEIEELLQRGREALNRVLDSLP